MLLKLLMGRCGSAFEFMVRFIRRRIYFLKRAASFCSRVYWKNLQGADMKKLTPKEKHDRMGISLRAFLFNLADSTGTVVLSS